MDNATVPPREYFKYLEIMKVIELIDQHIKDEEMDEKEFTWIYLKENLFCIVEIDDEESYYKIVERVIKLKFIAERTSQVVSCVVSAEMDDMDTMYDELEISLRNYYKSVADAEEFTFTEKLKIIYLDLVLPQSIEHDTLENLLYSSKMTTTYAYKGRFINEVTTNMVSCGRFPLNTIVCGGVVNMSVSRCNFIMIQIKNELFVLSGWSLAGTRCIARENKAAAQYSGNMCFMRFGVDESFVIEVGDCRFKERITFNPKHCVVCLENKCEVRGSCHHATLCNECFSRNEIVRCPICRQVYGNTMQSICVETYNRR